MPPNVKVSVVVAVYNPGPNIEGLVSSLEAQTLAKDQFEVIFVDDGSTDGTPERLAEVARTRPNVVVTTIPNSGWPGRPRNIGTDLSHGEYVFYADHDDEFYPEALERMYAMAQANGSDILYGKIVRTGRTTPYWPLARRNSPKADPMEALASRTVHKLYRREFLREHRIRFPEGPVRLEDHNFMAQALPHAGVISVLADYPCYRWIHRPDGSNNSDASVEASTYWGYYAGVLRTMEARSGPGPLLDATRVTAMVQAFSRIPPAKFLRRDPSDRVATFRALRALVLEQVPPRLDGQIPVLKRLRVQALRSDQMSRFEALQRARTRISFTLRRPRVAWEADRLLVGVDAAVVSARDDALAMDRVGDGVALPRKLGAPTGPGTQPCVLTPSERGEGEITLRHRRSGVEWPVVSTSEPETLEIGKQQAGLALRIHGTVDPARGFFGAELEDGIWDVLIRMQFLGEHQVRRVPLDAETALPGAPRLVGGRAVLAYRTQAGNLAIKITAVGPPRVRILSAGWESDHLVLTLDLPDASDPQLVVKLRSGGSAQNVPVDEGRAKVVLGPSVQGDIFDFWLQAATDHKPDQRLAFGEPRVDQRLPYRIYPTTHGSFSVKNVGPSATPTPQPASRTWGWRSRRPGSS